MSHTSQESLQKELEFAQQKVKIGSLYYHYKDPDQYYVIEFIGFLENSEEVCIGYRAIYGKGILWVRTVENFLSKKNGKNRFKQRN